MHIYNLNEATRECGPILGDGVINHVIPVDSSEHTVELIEVKKSLVRRSIEQLGFIKDVNSLVVLSGQPILEIYIWHFTH